VSASLPVRRRVEPPVAAEAAVAQVGTDVGGQMEEAYRRVLGAA
jgi:hypothetical protein